jgi:hypothetical protein
LKKGKHPKCIKKKQDTVNFLLGKNTKLKEIMNLVDLTIFGHFQGKRMSSDTLTDWMKGKFSLEVGYSPLSIIMVTGWMIWIFKSRVEVENILHKRWKLGTQPLFLKKCHLDFNAQIFYLELFLVWVRILGLPLVLWLDEVFAEVGNVPKYFYEVNKSYLELRYMGME